MTRMRYNREKVHLNEPTTRRINKLNSSTQHINLAIDILLHLDLKKRERTSSNLFKGTLAVDI